MTTMRRDFRTLFVFTLAAWALAGALVPAYGLAAALNPIFALLLVANFGGGAASLSVLTAAAWVGETPTVHVARDTR